MYIHTHTGGGQGAPRAAAGSEALHRGHEPGLSHFSCLFVFAPVRARLECRWEVKDGIHAGGLVYYN